eukprot:CAMPEP_0113940240 /NCGR_PEP_ID=MMETSP1339-20121228/6412_1 /TAXON_ID=94617 /ORGANISM="Fibrocapsa japonica" /LENGTH=156 /DNA_ID=CAMNT_0000943997 /DNA_START=50 /DNA_END=520 /DNA_ORIENTATION=+ /assembly_acc=CAM_ASM_000762
MMDKKVTGKDRLILFKKLDTTKNSMLEFKDTFELNAIDSWLQSAIDGNLEMRKMRKTPQIKEWGDSRPQPPAPPAPAAASSSAPKTSPAQEDTPPEPKRYTSEEIEQIKRERRQREQEKREQLEEEMEDFISSATDDDELLEDIEEDDSIETLDLD